MKNLILYKSKHGTAKQYAEWIKEKIDGDIYSIDNFDSNLINEYDKVVISSCVYFGDIKARKFLIKNWDLLRNKKVYLLAVGVVFNNDAKVTYEMIPEDIRKHIKYLKVPGRINMESLNLLEKLVVKLRKGKDLDNTDKSYILPVVEFFNK